MEAEVMIVSSPEDEARDPATASERLAKLAEDAGLAPLVAANPNAPPEVLLRLLSRFPRHVIENPVLPLLLIENPEFFKGHERELLPLIRVADVPSFVTHVLHNSKDKLARDAVRYHKQCVGEAGPAWEIHAQAAIRRRPYHIASKYRPRLDANEIVKRFCAVPDVPVWLLTAFAVHRVDAVRLAVATYPGMTNELLDAKRSLTQYPHLPPNIVARLSRDANRAVRATAAQCADLAEEDIVQLAADADANVRAAVAANPHMPADVLRQMAHDFGVSLFCSLARNPQSPPDVLERIARGDDYTAFAELAANPSVTQEIFAQIGSGDRGNAVIKEESICFHICRHPYATNEVRRRVFSAMLRGLAPYGAWHRRATILSSPLAPASLLSETTASIDWLDRFAVARNPSADITTLHTLARYDGNRFVRAATRAAIEVRNS